MTCVRDLVSKGSAAFDFIGVASTASRDHVVAIVGADLPEAYSEFVFALGQMILMHYQRSCMATLTSILLSSPSHSHVLSG